LDQAALEAKLAELDAAERKFQKRPPSQVTDIVETPWPFQSWLAAINLMWWRVLRTQGPNYFLTSDNPAYAFEAHGLGNPESELIFPLCSERPLHCSWQVGKEAGIRVVEQKLVKEFNRRIASGADRVIFYHQRADWVFSAAQNHPHQLSRINWND
jgi:hypothetical protein